VKSISLLLAGVMLCSAQVRLTKDAAVVHVQIGGKAFADYQTGADFPKAFLSPLRSATGRIVTREWPMVADSGKTRDHLHHRGLWLGYIDVNGFNFWENEFSYQRANAGKIVTKSVDVQGAAIHSILEWVGPADQKVLSEERTLTFSGDSRLRIVDFESKLTAIEKASFGDDKDGALGLRVADSLVEKGGTGVITNSQGHKGMKEVWGKPANWVDYSGEVDGEAVGIVIFEHPRSFHHPARWHARDYGLLAANPFSDKAYDPAVPARNYTLRAGESITLRFRIVVHPKLQAGEIEKLYQAWTK
jgi:Methane oxygenase PmoA